MTYRTTCPMGHDALRLASALVTFDSGPTISRDGFDLTTARGVHTEDEIVACAECAWTGRLETTEESP